MTAPAGMIGTMPLRAPLGILSERSSGSRTVVQPDWCWTRDGAAWCSYEFKSRPRNGSRLTHTAGIPHGGNVKLREALEVLGVDRVRAGMMAFDGHYPSRS